MKLLDHSLAMQPKQMYCDHLPNKSLQWIFTPLRSVKTREFNCCTFRISVILQLRYRITLIRFNSISYVLYVCIVELCITEGKLLPNDLPPFSRFPIISVDYDGQICRSILKIGETPILICHNQ